MAGSSSSPKCLHCNALFDPDSRNRGRQRFCSAAPCRQASKRHSQALWLQQPANKDYFKGPSHSERVRQWRARNPGYWRRHPRTAPEASQGSLPLEGVQPIDDQGAKRSFAPVALQDPSTSPLQDPSFSYPPVLVGLVALQTGIALQEDIHAHLDRMAQSGLAILRHGAGGWSLSHDRSSQSPPQARTAPPSPLPLQLV